MPDDRSAPDLPPHSFEAETSVLGALFLSNAVADDIRGELDSSDFYADRHRVIFEHITSLIANAEPADVVTVQASLQSAGKLDYVGGLDYLGAIVANVPTSVNARHYAKIVHDRADRRRIAGDALNLNRIAIQTADFDSDDVREQLNALLRRAETASRPRWSLPGPISTDELSGARPTPDCIVENYLYSDVALLAAPGGVGKTTLLLYESVHVVLGLPLYGNTVRKPGPVLIITAEDTREMLVARLRLIANAMQLDTDQLATVMRDVRIADVSGGGFKMTSVADDVVIPSPNVDTVIAECRQLRPVVVVMDPAVSFGVGEQRVNDAEQGLIEAARRIRNAIGCCVRYVHHTGKANAREGKMDQYAGRGGSALPDGCRMVAVLQPMTPELWQKATGMSLLNGEQGMVLARPKLSYCAPGPDILITRKGFAFTHTARSETDAATELEANCAQVLRLIETAIGNGEKPTQNSLEARQVMSRAALRGAVSMLLSRGRIFNIKSSGKGGAQQHLSTQAAPDAIGAPWKKTP